MTSRRSIEAATSREMRELYLQEAFLPVASAAFARDPVVQSLVLAISQYWNDEAEDAVHLELVPCPVRDPRWPDCLRDNPYVLLEEFDDGESFETLDERGEALCGWEVMREYPDLDENSSAIVAFASCCPEERSQEEPMSQAYQPYAIARRGPGGDAALEVVGRVLRPEWEDRFDVGFNRPDDPAVVPADPGVQVAPPGPLKRILRLIKGGG